MRSEYVLPAGLVWSKKPSLTMSAEWPSAALASFVLALRAGRPACARTWLCRQRIAAPISGRLSAAGTRSVLVQATVAVALTVLGLALVVRALTLAAGRLSPRAIVATGSLGFFFVAAPAAGPGTSRPTVIAAAGTIRVRRVFSAGIGATSKSIACVSSRSRFLSTRRAHRARILR